MTRQKHAIATSCARACRLASPRLWPQWRGRATAEQLRDDVAKERRELGEQLPEQSAVSWREFVTERACAGDEAARNASPRR